MDNIAVGGATAANYEGAPSNAQQQAASVTQPYDFAFIMFGTNDYGYTGTISPSSSYQGIHDAVVTLLTKFPNMQIFGVIPPYMPGDTVRNASGRTALVYKEWIRQAFVDLGCPTIDFTNGLSWNASNWDEKLMPWDKNLTRLHPTQDAYVEMGTMAAASWRVNGSGTWKNPSFNMQGYVPTPADGAGFTDNNTPPIFWRDPEGNMYVDFGEGTYPNSDGLFFTLPENLRPYRQFYITALDASRINQSPCCAVNINADGTVRYIGDKTTTASHNQVIGSGVVGSIWFTTQP